VDFWNSGSSESPKTALSYGPVKIREANVALDIYRNAYWLFQAAEDTCS